MSRQVMDIRYLGNTALLLKGDRTVAMNPGTGMDRPDIALHTKRQRSQKLIVNGPGEYEIGGVLIGTVALGDLLAHAVELDGINVVLVVGDASKLDERALATLGRVDVLLVNADDVRMAQAAVSELTPRVVVPFGEHATEICSAVGVKDASAQARFSWNGTTNPPTAVLL